MTKTILKYSDEMLKLPAGRWIMVCEPVTGFCLPGGVVKYKPGDRLRVEDSYADLLWCLDTNDRTVTFDRTEMACLEPET